MIGYVYILRAADDRLYVGSTSNLEYRMRQHIAGHTQTTRNMKKFALVFKQETANLKIARAAERKLKKLKRKDYLEKIIKDGYIKILPP